MKDPAFLFYPNDYIGGTLGMTFEQKGAYIELLMMQFNRGHMTTHMIGQLLGQRYDDLWSTLQSKFQVDEQGMYFNGRLEVEQNKRKLFTESRKNNKTGKNQYQKEGGHMTGHTDGHTDGHMEDRNRNEINIEFDVFWNLYEKKVGSIEKLKVKWNGLKDSERTAIIDYIPKYKLAQPDKKFRKNPETFFSKKAWNDELIVDSKPKKYDGKLFDNQKPDFNPKYEKI